jgi:hypothetical protein
VRRYYRFRNKLAKNSFNSVDGRIHREAMKSRPGPGERDGPRGTSVVLRQLKLRVPDGPNRH